MFLHNSSSDHFNTSFNHYIIKGELSLESQKRQRLATFKALAMRMQTVLDNIVDHDQVGYIKDCVIGVNICTAANTLVYNILL